MANVNHPKRATPAGSSRAGNRREQRAAHERRAMRRKRLIVLGGVGGLALLTVLGFILYSSRSGSGGGGATAASDRPINVPALYGDGIPMDGKSMGDPKAKVVLQEWGDYQCPGCGIFARTAEQQFIDEYVKTGKIRFEFHDFAFLDGKSSGKESQNAAQAAACAGDQGKFWDYHRTLYFNQADKENSGGFATTRLIAAARALGLDEAQFAACLTSGTHKAAVDASNAQGDQLAINQTPTFFVNGTKLSGATTAAIKQALDAAIAGQ